MNDEEILREWTKEVIFCRDNVVINNCKICKKLFRQKSPDLFCEKCKVLCQVF